jgi:DNA segregation ATPase FtsK/SpoIIIE, S-DNA-T family
MTLLENLPRTATRDAGLSASTLRPLLRDLGIETSRVETEPGMRVSQAHIKVGSNVRIKQVRAMAEDLAIRLSVASVRVRSGVKSGMITLEFAHELDEVPTVSLGDVVDFDRAQEMALPWAVGLEADGAPMLVDLAEAPHVLIGGQTGSGKSSHLHSLVTSLAMLTMPSDVELIFVDPKQVDLVPFRDLPHVRRAPVTTPTDTAKLLRELSDEVEFRYQEFAHANVTDLAAYNRWAEATEGEETMPRMVLLIDELAMVMTGPTGEQLAEELTKLAQVCRAAGLHLVMATQRPSASSMPTQLRSQLTTRVACRMATVTDSRMILDAAGAEKLLGAGDSLIRWGGAEPVRVQGTFVTKAWAEYITTEVSLHFHPELEQTDEPETEEANTGDLTEIHAESNLLEDSPLKMSTGPKMTGALFMGGLLIGTIVAWLIGG